MRRLQNSRAPEPDDAALEGFDRAGLEGDAIGPVADELPWLRPFGADIPGLSLATTFVPERAGAPGYPAGRASWCPAGRSLDAPLCSGAISPKSPRTPKCAPCWPSCSTRGRDSEAALEELTAALAHAADPVPVLVHRGHILARRGRTAEASGTCATRSGASLLRAGAFPLGSRCCARGLAPDATAALREALRYAPDDPDATYYLGEALEAQGDLPVRSPPWSAPPVLAPPDPRTYKLMGRLLDRMGGTDDARAMHKGARGRDR